MATTAPALAPATRRGGPDWWQNFWSRAESKTCRFLPKFNLEEKSWATWSWRKAASGWLPTASEDLPRGHLRGLRPGGITGCSWLRCNRLRTERCLLWELMKRLA